MRILEVTVQANLEGTKNEVRAFAKKLCSALAEEGKDYASSYYAQSNNVHINDVVVYSADVSDGSLVVAQGESVGFAEFGAGVTASPYPDGEDLGFQAVPGSWSITHAKQFITKGYWYYRKKKYFGIEPTHAMYKTRKHILSIKDSVAKGIK